MTTRIKVREDLSSVVADLIVTLMTEIEQRDRNYNSKNACAELLDFPTKWLQVGMELTHLIN